MRAGAFSMNDCCNSSSYQCAPSGAYFSSSGRGFLTRAEKIELLKEYKEQLDLESKGVGEKIAHLENVEKNA